jgi:uncharacterized repeat protein (TIGR01451 family)
MRSRVRRYLALLWGALILGVGAAAPGWAQSTSALQLFLTQAVDHAQAQPGDEITFTLTYINGGAGTATGVAIGDVLPQNTTLVGASNGGILFGNTVFWSAGTLASRQRGTVALQVRVNPNLPPGTTITNTAQISSVEAPIGVPSNSITVTVVPVLQPSLLSVTLGVDVATAAPGSLINFLFTVANPGPNPATGVTLVSPIPAGTTPVAASDGGVLANGAATWALGLLAPGSTRQVSLQVMVTGGAIGSITGAAQVSSIEAPAPASSNTVSVAVSPGPGLSLTETVDKPAAAPGDTLTYTLAFSGGAVNSAHAALFTTLPAGTQFVSASNGGVFSGESVIWTFDTLPAGGAVSFTIRISTNAIAGTLIQNQAQLAVPAQGTVISSNTVTSTVALSGAFLTLAMSVDRTAARVGDLLTYTLTYANVGGTAVDGAAILDSLPAGLDFVGSQANVQFDPSTRTLRFILGSLAPGATGTVSFQASVDAAVTGGTSLNNQAQLVAPSLPVPVVSNGVTVGVGAASFVGTYKLILSNPADPTSFVENPTSITVDPQNQFTISSIPGDQATPNLGAQGSLNADGTFDVTTASGQVRFTGRIDPTSQTAAVTVQRAGLASYTLVLPRAPDFSLLPAALVGTFEGLATTPAGDQLQVRLSIDPVGNSTFVGDLIQLFPLSLNWRAGSYQVTPDGRLGFGGQTDGLLQAAGNTLALIYNYTRDDGYQAIFQVPLTRQ